MRRGPSGRFDTWLVLGGHAWEHKDALPRETLSLSVTGTNGMLPRKGLRAAAISRMGGGFTHIAAVRNLTAPTLPLYPPTADRFHWRVLSHLAPNYLSLLDAEVLRGSLQVGVATGMRGGQALQRVEAVIEHAGRLQGQAVRGHQVLQLEQLVHAGGTGHGQAEVRHDTPGGLSGFGHQVRRDRVQHGGLGRVQVGVERIMNRPARNLSRKSAVIPGQFERSPDRRGSP